MSSAWPRLDGHGFALPVVRIRVRDALVFALLSVALWQVACNRDAATATPAHAQDVVERGPYRLHVSAAPVEPLFGDPVTLQIQVQTPVNAAVRFPDADAFADWLVQADPAPAPQPAATRGWIWRRSYRLQATHSGDLEIPPVTVAYAEPAETEVDLQPEAGIRQAQPQPQAAMAPAGPQTSSYPHELTSSPLKIKVLSALTENDSPLSPRDIAGVRLPEFFSLSPAAQAGLLALALGLLGGWVWLILRLTRRPAHAPPPLAPEVWAQRALASLQPEPLLAGGCQREFYYSLSEIVRRYIELQFRLAAPERTSEEFFRELTRRPDALPFDAGALRRFMELCDLVKYAAYAPRLDDARDAHALARRFVEETAAAVAAQRARRTPLPTFNPAQESAA